MDKNTILIVGLGQIGTSISMALQVHSDRFFRIGHTRQIENGKHAKKMGIVDKVAINLPSAAQKADIVVLALPMDQVEGTLKLLSGELKEGCVILDTSPSRTKAAEWAIRLLPEDRYYLGFSPVLNPKMLHGSGRGIEEASDNLFHDGMFVITAAMNTNSEALNLASDLVGLLRATPMFADTVEVDSYMAAMHVLPQLLAASLTNFTVESPGWGELRKLAGRPYALLTNLIENMDSPEALSLAARLDRDHILHSLDGVIRELSAMREELAEEANSQFDARIARAGEGRRRWWYERQQSKWLHERGADADLSGISGNFG